jgi:hypothetical protein
MKIKLKKVSIKPFILIFVVMNAITGLGLGAVVTVMSLLSPTDQSSAGVGGPWAIFVFPILNGLLALATGMFFCWLYNLMANYLGGVELEFDEIS